MKLEKGREKCRLSMDVKMCWWIYRNIFNNAIYR